MDQWYLDYDEKDITPRGLKCRNLYNFPSNPEIKVPGPKFATNIGRSLDIFDSGMNNDLKTKGRIKSAPFTIARRMECRQFVQFAKLTEDLRTKLILGLKFGLI